MKLISFHNKPDGFLKQIGCLLLLFEGFLGIAHVLWAEYTWGQDRLSYFNFSNSLTLASWLLSMQLIVVAGLSLTSFYRDRQMHLQQTRREALTWVLGSLLVIGLSLLEMTRVHERIGFLGYPERNVYEYLLTFSGALILLGWYGWFVLNKVKHLPIYRHTAWGWLLSWTSYVVLEHISVFIPERFQTVISLLMGLTSLAGCTLLLMSIGGYALRPRRRVKVDPLSEMAWIDFFPTIRLRILLLTGTGLIACIIFLLQMALLQLLTISADYLTAHSIISSALLGSAVGGVIGFLTAHYSPLRTILISSLLLPVMIILAFSSTIALIDMPLLVSTMLMMPFLCTSIIIAIVLTRVESHLAYAIVLVGGGLSTVLIGPMLSNLREEGTLLLLASSAALAAMFFIGLHPVRRMRLRLWILAGLVALGLFGGSLLNVRYDGLNVVRAQLNSDYPSLEILFSRSSFVGRYDVLRREPGDVHLKTYENGRVSDTIRPYPVEMHQIDPRLPHTLYDDPTILIIGVSGDAITKSARFMSSRVYGAEINPVIVELQTNELLPWNANSYDGIDVTVIDGRSYVEGFYQTVDIITLMNTHFSRGATAERATSPEYLYTTEALHRYMDILSESGILIVEEPVGQPDREPPVWKLLYTMRQVLLERGHLQPDQHFFIFQWHTNSNNYIQIVMKKTPLTDADIVSLQQWLYEVDHIRDIEADKGQRVGPIRTATTTKLYVPGQTTSTNISRIVRGDTDDGFRLAYNLRAITDDRPFMFDVDPTHNTLIKTYRQTMILVLPLFLLLVWLLRRALSTQQHSWSYLLLVSLTGIGYLFIEVFLIQRYTLFLGSPLAAFTSVVGSLLIFSGLGSLWSGRLSGRGIYLSLGGLVIMLIAHHVIIPFLLPSEAALKLPLKIILIMIATAPLGFFLGIPFPFVLSLSKTSLSEPTVAILYASNSATSALAVPLVFNLAVNWGFNAVFLTSLFIYVLVILLLWAIYDRPVSRFGNILAVFTLCLLFISPWISGQPASVQAEPVIYGVSYGQSSVAESVIYHDGSSFETVPFEWMFWIIEVGDRTILIDTGFYDLDLINLWNLTAYVHPLERLNQMGITPQEVDDVILTHAHWDHIGLVGRYPQARIWIQQEEYEYATTNLSPENISRQGMRWVDLGALMVAESEGRLRLPDGETEVMPGITLIRAGGHTPGSQYVRVETRDGPVIIAGDNTYYYDNNQSHRPIGHTIDREANLLAIGVMQHQAASPFLILPGHDPLVMNYFPLVSEGIVTITFSH